jgi:hypothetical protein
MRWFAAGCFLLAMSLAAIAQDPDTIFSPAASVPARQIPILTGTGQDTASADHFQATVNPLVTQRAPNTYGVLADSADEYVDFGWHLPVLTLFTIGYDTGVNAFRQDQTIWDDEEATSQVTTALINKPSLQAQAGPLKWTGYVQTQRSFTDGLPGYTDSTKYGAEAAWTPVKDVTTVTIDASTQETVNFNQSITDEDLYTASIDQKLPYIPFTLHTAGSLTDDTAPLLAVDDKDNTIVNASLLWKIVPAASATVGAQQQDTSTPASLQLANTRQYFTQLSLQTAPSVILNLGAARDQTASTAAGQFLSAKSDLLLTVGVTWTLGDRFNLGAGLNYRALQSQTPAPAPALNTPPATFSVSAGGHF